MAPRSPGRAPASDSLGRGAWRCGQGALRSASLQLVRKRWLVLSEAAIPIYIAPSSTEAGPDWQAWVPVQVFRLAGPEDRPVIERVINQGWPMTGAAAGGAAGAAAAAAAGAGAAAAGGGRRRQQTPRTPSPRRRRRSSCACWPRTQSSTTRSATQVMQPRRGEHRPGHDRARPRRPAPLRRWQRASDARAPRRERRGAARRRRRRQPRAPPAAGGLA